MIVLTACNMKRTRDLPEHYFGLEEVPVARAIFNGEGRELKRLLKQGSADISRPGKEGCTFLQYALKLKEYKMMEILLEQGADPNVISPRTRIRIGKLSEGTTYDELPLETSCHSIYSIKYMQLLVKYGAKINDNRVVIPLDRAISGDQRNKINYLLSKGADVNLAYEDTGGTVLLSAAILSNWELVELFLNYGADPFHSDKRGIDLYYYIQQRINRKGTPEGARKVWKLIRRLEKQGMQFDFSKAKIQRED